MRNRHDVPEVGGWVIHPSECDVARAVRVLLAARTDLLTPHAVELLDVSERCNSPAAAAKVAYVEALCDRWEQWASRAAETGDDVAMEPHYVTRKLRAALADPTPESS